MAFRNGICAAVAGSAIGLVLAAVSGTAPGQSEPETEESDAPAAAEQVIIDREALRLIDPETYAVSLRLKPARPATLLAPTSGIVERVIVKPGEQVASQLEAVRLDKTEQSLLLTRAEALRRAAEVELRRAGKQNDSDLVELKQARLDAAKAEEQLARHRLHRMSIRVPFEARVIRVSVSEGQPVKAGDPLVEIGDTSRMQVEIPVDRNQVQPGQTVELRVEKETVEATVQRLLPPGDRFEPLGELVGSLRSAVAVIDNPGDRFHVGQAVRVPIVPEHYVTQVPNKTLANIPDGRRKVQVVRKRVVRDVPVRVLAQVGETLSYVTGPFVPGDEVIMNSSKELPDGTRVRPLAAASAESASEKGGGTAERTSRDPSF